MNENQSDQDRGVGLPIGSKIGKYEILKRLAIGGQAIIYKCHDPLLDRIVAVKQISAHLAEDRKFLERFRKEAQILARLGAEQQAVVTIYELIEDQRGLFIVMEFVEGHTLETILSKSSGPVETKAALQILWRLAAALHNVHAAGIIHRDIKPANIIICEGLRPKITDFGVAAGMSSQTSMLLGTTKYMAPELFSGEDVDGRADMYSLGLIAYEMLIGREKFDEIFADVVRDPRSESLRWMKWHGDRKVAAPVLDEANPSIPPALAEIVARMMAKDRDERFANMEMLGRAIRSAFSPRGSEAAAKAYVAVAAGAAATAFEQTPGISDAGDELEIEEDSVRTTMLPRQPKAFKAKLIAAIAVFVIALSAAVGVVVHKEMNSRARREQAQAAFKAAEPAYRNAVAMHNPEQYHSDEMRQEIIVKYQQALDGFSDIQEEYPNTPYGGKASIMQLLCRARLGVLKKDWDLAAKQMNQADEAIKQAQRSASRTGEMYEWTRRTRRLLDNFDIYRRNARAITTALAKVDAALRAGDFDEARQAIADELQSPGLEKNRTRLRMQIDRAQFAQTFKSDTNKLNALLDRVGVHVDSGEFEKARQSLSGAAGIQKDLSALLKSELADALSKDDRDKSAKLLATVSKKFESLGLYVEAMERAEAARLARDPQAEQQALKKAKLIMPAWAKKIDLRIKKVRISAAMGAADKAMAAGDLTVARARLDEVLKIDPGNKAALQQIEKLEIAKKFSILKRVADDAFAAGDHKRALDNYTEALKIKPGDAAVAAAVTDCRFELMLADAKRLFEAKDYDQASEKLEAARKLKPTAADKVDVLLEDYQSWRQYDKLLRQGDEAGKGGDWGKAKVWYQKAMEVHRTREVQKRLARSHYEQWMASAKLAIEADNPGEAKAHLKQARSKALEAGKDEREINKLVADVDKLLKKVAEMEGE